VEIKGQGNVYERMYQRAHEKQEKMEKQKMIENMMIDPKTGKPFFHPQTQSRRSHH
jgi:hypothetical protein